MENQNKGNLLKQRALHNNNFTIMHNEILFKKDENGSLIDLETLGLFWRILSLPLTWELNIKGLASISGCSCDKIIGHLNKLKELGYIKLFSGRGDNGTFVKNIYLIKETLNSELWTEENFSEIVNIENEQINNPLSETSIKNIESYPHSEIPNPDIPYPDIPYPENRNYKVCTNKVSSNKESTYKESTFINKSNIQKNILTKGNSLQEKNDKLDAFSKNEISIEKTEQQENIQLSENTQQVTATPQKNRVVKDFKLISIKKSDKNSKRKHDRIEDRNVDDVLNTKMGDLSISDNMLARQQHDLNILKEKIIEQERKTIKSNTKKKRVRDFIETTFSSEPEIKDALLNFADMYMQRKNVLTVPAFELLLEDLYTITKNPKEMIKIINTSIKKSYLGFYPEQKNEASSFKNTPDKQINLNNLTSSPLKSVKSPPVAPKIEEDKNEKSFSDTGISSKIY